MKRRYRIAADTGGTFTDFVFLDELSGRLQIAKLPSTPSDPSEAVASGVAELLGGDPQGDDVVFFSHGTTVGTNALLERKGARTGLLVTEGFRGIYEVQEQMRGYGPAVFDFFFRKPALLAAPRDTLEVPERIGARGEVVRPLEEAAVAEIVRRVRQLGVESLAICLLFAFRNPEHERRLAAALAELAPGLPVSLSSEILPQIREYYRLSTTVINAYLRPVLGRYLGRLDSRLRDIGLRTPQRYVMQSNGGVTSLGQAAGRAVTTILSGPAGGVIACQAIGRVAGHTNLITFDMGGTSCDVALIREGQPGSTTLTRIGGVGPSARSGQAVAVPMLDIHTVSAGGGTIARVEWLGGLPRLKVGPDSAGARPGPAAYGQGGRESTVTDANTVLGYLRPETRLAGRLPLDREAARQAIRQQVAEPLGLSIEAAAEGILRVIDVQMEEAIKAISTRRGYDLRGFTLVAFGGAGPLHATRVARQLGIAAVLVPPYPGVTSAIGLLLADVRHDYVRSRLDSLHSLDPILPDEIFAVLEAEATAELEAEGFGPDQRRLLRQVDLRYVGQGYELTMPLTSGADGSGKWEAAGLARLRAHFDQEHERQFGHNAPNRGVEIVNYRVSGFGLVTPLELPRWPLGSHASESAQVGEHTIYLGEGGSETRCTVFARERLGPGYRFEGPAIVEQLDATTLVLPGQQAVVDDFGSLLIREADSQRASSTEAVAGIGAVP